MYVYEYVRKIHDFQTTPKNYHSDIGDENFDEVLIDFEKKIKIYFTQIINRRYKSRLHELLEIVDRSANEHTKYNRRRN